MNTSTTRWLILLAVGLGIFIFLFDRVPSRGPSAEASAGLLLPELNVSKVNSLIVTRGTNLAFRVERRGAGWEFRSPLIYPASAPAVEQLLDGLAGLRTGSRITPAEILAQTNGLAAFGFVPPAAILSLTQNDQHLEIRFGGQTLLGKEMYVEVVGRTGLFAVERTFFQSLPPSIDTWRDAALASLAGLRLDRLEVRPATNGFELTRRPDSREWRITRPLLLQADSGKVEFLLQQLDLARVIQFISDDPGTDLEACGLQPPERELVLGRGTNDLCVLQIGRSPTQALDQVYVRRLAHSNVVLVPRSVVAPWLARFTDFCDKHMMTFRPEAVQRIESAADEAFALERSTNGVWNLVQPFRATADPKLTADFLRNLAELEFLDFEREVVTDFAAYGLAPPRRRYALLAPAPAAPGQTPTNAVLAQLDIGSPSTFKFFARRSPENSVVTIVDNQRLPRAAYELRDRQIWSLSTNQILSVTVQQMGQKRKLLRTGPAQWALAPDSEGRLNPMALEEAAFRLGQLRAERWVARGEDQLGRYGFGALDHRVIIEANIAGTPASFTVRFGRLLLVGTSAYAAVNLDAIPGPIVFECPAAIYQFVASELSLVPSGPR